MQRQFKGNWTMTTGSNHGWQQVIGELGLFSMGLLLTQVLQVSTAHAAVPSVALIEGTLATAGGTPAADGNYSIKIGLYKDAVGGAPLWTEQASIEAKGGQFQHALGSAANLAQPVLAAAAYIGIAVASDPELPRKPLHSVLYAARAGTAESIACSGCIQAAHLDTVLANDLKSAVKASELSDVAKSGNYADLQGTPNLSAYAKTSDLKKVALTGSYADLTDKPVMAAVGSACGSGLLVKGIKADGALDCAAGGAANLPPDAIDEVSNGLIFNTFVDKKPGTTDVQIPDFAGPGVSDVIDFPDIGIAQKVWIEMSLQNSDLSAVKIELYGPSMSTPYLLYNGGKSGNSMVIKFNDDTPLVTGDMDKDWIGKNIKGLWSITVRDLKDNTPQNIDGKFNWSVNIQTLSNKKIQIKGDLIIDGNVTVGGTNQLAKPPTYRWALWSTYDYWSGWAMSDQANEHYLGIKPSTWGDSNAIISNGSGDKDILRTVFNKEGKIYKNITVWNEGWRNYSSTNSKHAGFWVRIKNTTQNDITWTPAMWYTSGTGWGMKSSITVNGANSWGANDCQASCSTTVNLAIPKNRTSSVVFAIGSQYGQAGEFCYLLLAFKDGSLKLPAGLEWAEDYDYATGGWEN